ncbi:MAG: peptide-methionine (S)-S-oxide reductase MsrA [Fusobacteriaceae bacterium]
MKTIFLAGGCFWGVEKYFQLLPGVMDTEVGYANSIQKNPTYEEVCSGRTLSAEACRITFDETVISFQNLLQHFFDIIDPTLLNRQGNDIGSQYRTGIYYLERGDEISIKAFILDEQKKYREKIVTEVGLLGNFYLAEDYHQDYLIKNPGGYCHLKHKISELLNTN